MSDPAGMRRQYRRGALGEDAAMRGWLAQFRAWFDDASAQPDAVEANAMQVATVDPHGRPAVRTVLLKAFDERGLVFYTNYDSAKGHDLTENPYAAAVLAWVRLERQVRVSGPVSHVDRAETDAYFASRPRGSQLGAWASPQSRVVAARSELEAGLAAVEQRFEGRDVPTPPHWGGFRIEAAAVEFWQGRPDRMHDRFRHRREGSNWVVERLAP